MEFSKWFFTSVAVAIMFILFALYDFLAFGFVGMKLWGWFIVPTFHLAELSILQAYGIALLIALWTKQATRATFDEATQKSEKVNFWLSRFLIPWIILLTGWITYCFMK